jgi:hypothetical protein
MEPGDFESWAGLILVIIGGLICIVDWQSGNYNKFIEDAGAALCFIGAGFFRISEYITESEYEEE